MQRPALGRQRGRQDANFGQARRNVRGSRSLGFEFCKFPVNKFTRTAPPSGGGGFNRFAQSAGPGLIKRWDDQTKRSFDAGILERGVQKVSKLVRNWSREGPK